jgi:hypothetical protein
VMAVLASKIPAGSQVRAVSAPHSLAPRVRAYGFAQNGGFALVLFNNTLKAIAVSAEVSNSSKKSFSATLTIYGKAQYDKSKANKWIGPVSRNLGTVGTTVPLTLDPYSISVLNLRS